MSLSDFIHNITTPGALTTLVEDMSEITGDLIDELSHTCRNEGVEVLKATPAAVKEVTAITGPIVSPTPVNIARSAYSISKTIQDFTQE